MDFTKDNIFHLIQKIDSQRTLMNHSDIGFGMDVYENKSLCHYDEAYALWGLGYLNLFQIENK